MHYCNFLLLLQVNRQGFSLCYILHPIFLSKLKVKSSELELRCTKLLKAFHNFLSLMIISLELHKHYCKISFKNKMQSNDLNYILDMTIYWNTFTKHTSSRVNKHDLTLHELLKIWIWIIIIIFLKNRFIYKQKWCMYVK